MAQYQDKKTKKWKYRVYVIDIDGSKDQKEKTGFKTKQEAKQAEINLIIEYENRRKEYFEKRLENTLSFTNLWNEYHDFIKLKRKANSYRTVKNRIENHVYPFFKKFDNLEAITSKDYIEWQMKIEKKDYSHKYNTALHNAVVQILNYAIKNYGLSKNIASNIGNFKKKKLNNPHVDFWIYEEYENFIKDVDNENDQIIFEFLYYTGARLGECLALNWNDFQDDYINITKTISKEFVDGERNITSPKSESSIRKVKLNTRMKENLEKYKIKCQKIINFKNEWFIFGGPKPLSPTTIERKKNMYCKRSNTKKIRIHDFRHSHASLLISLGAPITVVQNRLGHSDPSITLKYYSHMFPSDEDKAIDKINQLLP